MVHFASQVADWYCMIKVLAVECQGVNYSICHRAPFWIPNYPTFRYFAAFEDDYKAKGERLNSTDENSSGLIRATIRFLDHNPPRSWVFPTVQPLLGETNEDDMKQLFALQAAGSLRYVVLLIEDSNCTLYDEYLTKRIILDMSSYQQITIRRICKDTAQSNEYFQPILQEKIDNPIIVPTIWMEANVTLPENYTTEAEPPIENYVDLLVWDTNSTQKQLYISLPYASFFTYELKRLDGIGNRTQIDMELKQKLADDVAKAKFSLEPGKRLSPKAAEAGLIYMADFESTLNHMIFKEMCSVEELNGARLDAVRNMITTILDRFKGQNSTMKLLKVMKKFMNDKRQIPYTEWEETVNPFLEHRTFDSWVACVGSSPIYRGYSCGLWSLFHLLLTEAHLQKAPDAKLVPFVIRDYVLEVFSCRSCSDNFRREVKEFQIEKIENTKDAVMWLWSLHNSVNMRLKGDSSEDPEVPKFKYPPSWICRDCMRKTQFVRKNVFKFLLSKYANNNLSEHYLVTSEIGDKAKILSDHHLDL